MPSRAAAAVVAGGLALLLAAGYLLAPRSGQDLSAQLFRAGFARDHPFTPVDFNWFGGTSTFGYSLWTPLVMAWVGVRLTGAICSVIATVQVTKLFERGGARRPLAGGVLMALAQTVNLVAGRVTFGVGMVCGLGALLAVVHPRLSPRNKILVAALMAFLAGAASPVAALLLWVCAGALLLCGSVRIGVLVFVASAVPVLVSTAVFGDGGVQSFTATAFRYGLLATTLVAVLVPARPRELRVGALLGIVLLTASFVLRTPVGDNSLRLSFLFAAPIAAAFVTWRPWLAALAVVFVAFPQQTDSRYSFNYGPSSDAGYYAPLTRRIEAGGPLLGRVEIPETTAHWDDAFLGRTFPLARGWVRQLDMRLNERVFFDPHFSAARYRSWLRANAVEYVAVPDAGVTAGGRLERSAVSRGLPYLDRVWSDEHWVLYRVRHYVPIVRAPGQLTAMSANSLTLEAPAHAVVPVSLRWSRWLSVSSAAGSVCITPVRGGVVVRTSAVGRLVISSSLNGDRRHC